VNEAAARAAAAEEEAAALRDEVARLQHDAAQLESERPTQPSMATATTRDADVYLRNVLLAFMTSGAKERLTMLPAIARLVGFEAGDMARARAALREEDKGVLGKLFGAPASPDRTARRPPQPVA